MRTLAPVNFRAVAAKGCFVYCYLRVDGSPYYIGIAKRHSRPLQKFGHRALPPKDAGRVRVMRSGLSWGEACSWECFYIARYGRKDIGTGVLCNRTAGGEGVVGYVVSDKQREVAGARYRGRSRSASDMRGIAKQAEQRKHAAAEQCGMAYDVYSFMTRAERAPMKAWLRANPGRTGMEYVKLKSQGAFDAKARSFERAWKAGKLQGFTREEYAEVFANTSAADRERLQRWLCRGGGLRCARDFAAENRWLSLGLNAA